MAYEMNPKIIALSPAFLQSLQVDKNTAYALQPCFATRLEVYSLSTTTPYNQYNDNDINNNNNNNNNSNSGGGWVSCAILVGKRGQMYLFNPQDGRIINAARLSSSSSGGSSSINDNSNTSKTPAVEIIIQSEPNINTGTQEMYICCRNPLLLTHVHEFREVRSGNKKSYQISNTIKTDGMIDYSPGTFPLFAYILRFHCRNAPIALQMLRIITMFVNPTNGSLSLVQTDKPLQEELNPSAFLDPLDSTIYIQQKKEEAKQETQKGIQGRISSLRIVAPLKQLITSSSQPRDVVCMCDVAKYEKKRLLSSGENIEIPPMLDPNNPIRSISIPQFNTEKEGNSETSMLREGKSVEPLVRDSSGMSTVDYSSNNNNNNKTLMGENTEAKKIEVIPATLTSTLTQLYEEMSHFTFPAFEDVLQTYEISDFETQYALFLIQRSITIFIDKCVDRLLISLPAGISSYSSASVSAVQERIMAREIVREELRLHFGVTYLELNDTTKRRILTISPEQLALEEERVSLQRVYDAELQSLLQRYEEKRLQMFEEESNVYFTVNHELKSLNMGNLITPVCAEEMTEWREELIHTAATLEALEVEIQRVEDAINKDSDIYTYNNSQEKKGKMNKKSNNDNDIDNNNNNNNNNIGQFESLQDEARYLLSQIQQQQEKLTYLQKQMSNKDSIVENDIVNDKNSALGQMHREYNSIVVHQQEEINKLREELHNSAASFGINARWIAEQNIRNSVVNEILHNSHSK